MWVVSSRIVGILATVVGNIMAARLLGPAEYGRYLFISSVAICGSMLGGAGLADAVLRYTAENLALGRRAIAVAYVRRTVWMGLVTTVVAILVTAGGLAILQWKTGDLSQPRWLITFTVVTLVALAWQHMCAETLRGWNNLKLASLFSGGVMGGPISTLLFLGGVVGLYVAKVPINAVGAMALFAGSVTVTVPLSMMSVWRTVWDDKSAVAEPAVKLSSIESRAMLSMAGTLLAISLLDMVCEQLDIWIGSVALPPEDLGVYGVAKRCLLLVAMPVQMAMLATIGAIPRFYAQGRRRELQSILRGATTLAAIPSLAAISLLVLFPNEALQFLFGGSYDHAAPLIRILAVGYMVLVLVGTPINMLTLTGRHRTALIINVIGTTLMLVLGPLAASRYGVMGLASVTACTVLVQCGLQWWFAYLLSGVWTHAGLPRREVLEEIPLFRRLLVRTARPAAVDAAAAQASGSIENESDLHPISAGDSLGAATVQHSTRNPSSTCTRCGVQVVPSEFA